MERTYALDFKNWSTVTTGIHQNEIQIITYYNNGPKNMTFNEYYNKAANNKTLTNSDIFANCLVKAIKAKEENKLALANILLAKSFTPPSRPSKVANGALSYWGFHHARYGLSNVPVKSLLTEEEYASFRDLILKVSI